MRSAQLRRITHLALIASVVLVATAFLKVPTATGYIHLGDGVIYAAALALGPSFAAISGGIGSSLADILGGYFNWWPWTLVIKAAAGWIIGKIGYGRSRSRQFLGMLAGALWTVAGYAAGTSLMYDPKAAVAESLGNLIQVGSGVVIALVLGPILKTALGNGKQQPD